MATTFDHFSGPVILHATLHAQPGKADEVQKLLKAIHGFANSEKEPGCNTFRTCRSGDNFIVFEKYNDKSAVAAHFESNEFKALAAAIPDVLTEPPQLLYYEEFTSN